MDNVVLHNIFKVKKVGHTKTKLFRDLKKGDLIDLSIELDKEKDIKKSRRVTLYLNGQPTYISSLYNALKAGMEITEVTTKMRRFYEKFKELESGVKIIKVTEENLDIEKEIMILKGKTEYSQIQLKLMCERLKKIKSELAREGLVYYSGELQKIIDLSKIEKYGENDYEQHEHSEADKGRD